MDAHWAVSMPLLRRVAVTAHGEGGKLASETLPLAVTGKLDFGAVTVSVKNLETSSEKQQGQLEYPDSLKATIPLDPRSQLKVRVPGVLQ